MLAGNIIIFPPKFKPDNIGTSGTSFQKFEADESIPEHVKELYFSSLAALENADQRSRLAEMLRNYADCFAVNADDIGRTDLVKHVILLKLAMRSRYTSDAGDSAKPT